MLLFTFVQPCLAIHEWDSDLSWNPYVVSLSYSRHHVWLMSPWRSWRPRPFSWMIYVANIASGQPDWPGWPAQVSLTRPKGASERDRPVGG